MSLPRFKFDPNANLTLPNFQFNLDSSDEEEIPQTEISFEERLAAISATLPPDIFRNESNARITMCDGLLILFKWCALVYFWPVEMLDNHSDAPSFSDEMLKCYILHHRWMFLLSKWKRCLKKYTDFRFDCFKRDTLMAIHNDLNHPMITILDYVKSIKKIKRKRKVKRSPGALPVVYDAWTGNMHDMNYTHDGDIVLDASGKPIRITDELTGRKRILSQPKANAITGNDSRRLKEIIFYQRHSDLDRNALDMDELDKNEWYAFQAELIRENATDPLLKPFKVLLPQRVHSQIVALHGWMHFIDYAWQAASDHLLQQEWIPTSWDDAWIRLCGEKYASSTVHIDKYAIASKGYSSVIAQFRDVMSMNMGMICCDGCEAYGMVSFIQCKQCHETIRYCSNVNSALCFNHAIEHHCTRKGCHVSAVGHDRQ